jgi:hypothetical protein
MEPLGTLVTECETRVNISAWAPESYSNGSSSMSELSENDDDGNNLWITVQPRQSRSLESLRKLRSNKKSNFILQKMIHKELGNDPIIDAAVGNLTADQHEYNNKCDDTVRYYRDNDGPHEEGPLQPKGKGPDPLNWGGVNID